MPAPPGSMEIFDAFEAAPGRVTRHCLGPCRFVSYFLSVLKGLNWHGVIMNSHSKLGLPPDLEYLTVLLFSLGPKGWLADLRFPESFIFCHCESEYSGKYSSC